MIKMLDFKNVLNNTSTQNVLYKKYIEKANYFNLLSLFIFNVQLKNKLSISTRNYLIIRRNIYLKCCTYYNKLAFNLSQRGFYVF